LIAHGIAATKRAFVSLSSKGHHTTIFLDKFLVADSTSANASAACPNRANAEFVLNAKSKVTAPPATFTTGANAVKPCSTGNRLRKTAINVENNDIKMTGPAIRFATTEDPIPLNTSQ
jgi:hypothetical protein